MVWRRGLDLNPLSPVSDGDWLRALVWPGMTERTDRLEAALALAAADPPQVVQGDLVRDLGALAAQAPNSASLVVFHSAVLTYIPSQRRAEAVAAIRATGAHWIANEAPAVLAGLCPDAPEDGTDDFVLRLDGAPVARADGHGAYLRWLPS